MADAALDRRRFIVAAIALYGLPSALRHGGAWAQAGPQSDAATLRAIAAMARGLYPHDALADAVYAEVAGDALAAAAEDESLATALRSAEAALNAQQPGDFTDLGSAAQSEAIEAVAQEPFFGAIQAAVRQRIYNHAAIWDLLGYEGPSFQQGGYLNRGAGEIDWLPEGG